MPEANTCLRRATELAAGEGGARANTVFKLVGSNQEGKGSLCGIALLETLRRHCQAHGLPLVVWPLFSLDSSGVERPLPPPRPLAKVPDRCLVVIETYPSLHWTVAGFKRGRPWDRPGVWAAVRRRFRANASHVAPASGDEGDALIGWYVPLGTGHVRGGTLHERGAAPGGGGELRVS